VTRPDRWKYSAGQPTGRDPAGKIELSGSLDPEAENAAQEVLALPIFPELTRGQQEYVVEKINHYFEGGMNDGIFPGTDG
jgi:dTDP-4-amino-4,6-dideoxygalactose transaminase